MAAVDSPTGLPAIPSRLSLRPTLSIALLVTSCLFFRSDNPDGSPDPWMPVLISTPVVYVEDCHSNQPCPLVRKWARRRLTSFSKPIIRKPSETLQENGRGTPFSKGIPSKMRPTICRRLCRWSGRTSQDDHDKPPPLLFSEGRSNLFFNCGRECRSTLDK
jgi:hypothetical protein